MHDGLSKTQKEKIKRFIAAALKFNKTHNIFQERQKKRFTKKMY